jgi:hypothetical protein
VSLKTILWLSVLLLLALSGAFYWKFENDFSFRYSLTRGSRNMRSQSTEPYDIALRIGHKNNINFADGVPPKEWLLRLPRNYVVSEIGTNGAVRKAQLLINDQDKIDSSKRYFSITVNALAGLDGNTLPPPYGKLSNEIVNRFFSVTLENELYQVRGPDLCVPQDRKKDILEPLGFPGFTNRPCDRSNLRCGIDLHLSGWKVRLAVTKDLFSTPDNACALARRFLDQHTIRRDEIK